MEQRLLKSVVITGASSGIGRATTLRLVQEGYRVFAGVRRSGDGEALSEEGGDAVVPIDIDVTDEARIERAVATVSGMLGSDGLWALVNNAGLSCGGPLEYVDFDEVRSCFEVNVFGVLAVTRAFLPLLRRRGGRIVNMSSGVGRVAPPLVGPYAASKHALEALSDSLRIELRRAGVQVSLIEPGFVDTPMLGKGNEQTDRATRSIPEGAPDYYRHSMLKLRETFDAGKPVPPETVAAAVLRAVNESRPKFRYIVGTDAKMLVMLRRLLPERLMDKMLGKMVDL